MSKIKLKQSFNCILNAFKALKHAAVYTLSAQKEPNLWMKTQFHAIKDLKITQISLPGTHHSFYAPTGPWALIHGKFSKCQSLTGVEEQFKAGIRLFDLRVSLNPKDKEFYISHRFLSKVKLSSVLRDISKVIAQYPSEIILVFIREDFDNPLLGAVERLLVHSLIESSFENQLIPNFMHNSSFSELLEWGNVVVFGLEKVKSTNYWDFKYSFPFTQEANAHPLRLVESVCEYLDKRLVPPECINILDTVIGLNQWNFYLGIYKASKSVNEALKERLIIFPEAFHLRGNAFLLGFYHDHLDLVTLIISLNANPLNGQKGCEINSI